MEMILKLQLLTRTKSVLVLIHNSEMYLLIIIWESSKRQKNVQLSLSIANANISCTLKDIQNGAASVVIPMLNKRQELIIKMDGTFIMLSKRMFIQVILILLSDITCLLNSVSISLRKRDTNTLVSKMETNATLETNFSQDP